MKRLFFAFILIAGTLAASTSSAQVCFRGRVNFGFPAPRVYVAPRVIYSAPIAEPYYGGGEVVAAPFYGYGYRRHREAFYHERRWRGRDRW